jgi:hypothetical protein
MFLYVTMYHIRIRDNELFFSTLTYIVLLCIHDKVLCVCTCVCVYVHVCVRRYNQHRVRQELFLVYVSQAPEDLKHTARVGCKKLYKSHVLAQHMCVHVFLCQNGLHAGKTPQKCASVRCWEACDMSCLVK